MQGKEQPAKKAVLSNGNLREAAVDWAHRQRSILVTLNGRERPSQSGMMAIDSLLLRFFFLAGFFLLQTL